MDEKVVVMTMAEEAENKKGKVDKGRKRTVAEDKVEMEEMDHKQEEKTVVDEDERGMGRG